MSDNQDLYGIKEWRCISFWMHIARGQYRIRKRLFAKTWILSIYVFEQLLVLDNDWVNEFPFSEHYPFNYFELKEFSKIIKTHFGKAVEEMDYRLLMDVLVWYKEQALSGRKLKNQIFIKFFGDVNDIRQPETGRVCLDFENQLAENKNIICDVESGAGLTAGNIDDWLSCYNEHYGEKFLILKTLDCEKYLFSGKINYDSHTGKGYVDMSKGRQLVGSKFKVIDRGVMDETGKRKVISYMQDEEKRYYLKSVFF